MGLPDVNFFSPTRQGGPVTFSEGSNHPLFPKVPERMEWLPAGLA